MSPVTPDRQAFNELALHYEKTVDQELRKFWGVSYSAFVDRIIERMPPGRSGSILDVATGTGLIPRKLIQTHVSSVAQIVGLDLTFRALSQARQKTQPGWPVVYVQANAHHLPFAPGSFDTVICALATHHLARENFLPAMLAVLKDGGQLILADVAASPVWKLPGLSWLLRLAAFLYFLFVENPARAWIESEAVSHVYTVQDWERALQQVGFTQVRSSRPMPQRAWAPTAMLITACKPAANPKGSERATTV